MRALALLVGAVGLAAPALAQAPGSPYAGQEARELKALSPEDVRSLLAGEGMGLAKSAELNRYPGPRHVLDLATELGLSDGQRRAAQAVFDRMSAEARRLGAAIVERERRLDALFASGTIDEARLRHLTSEIGRLMGELRAVHLAAHLETRRLLTPAQVAAYDRLRGYGAASPHDGGGEGEPGHGHGGHRP